MLIGKLYLGKGNSESEGKEEVGWKKEKEWLLEEEIVESEGNYIGLGT